MVFCRGEKSFALPRPRQPKTKNKPSENRIFEINSDNLPEKRKQEDLIPVFRHLGRKEIPPAIGPIKLFRENTRYSDSPA
jgi:hypothetical protein